MSASLSHPPNLMSKEAYTSFSVNDTDHLFTRNLCVAESPSFEHSSVTLQGGLAPTERLTLWISDSLVNGENEACSLCSCSKSTLLKAMLHVLLRAERNPLPKHIHRAWHFILCALCILHHHFVSNLSHHCFTPPNRRLQEVSRQEMR